MSVVQSMVGLVVCFRYGAVGTLLFVDWLLGFPSSTSSLPIPFLPLLASVLLGWGIRFCCFSFMCSILHLLRGCFSFAFLLHLFPCSLHQVLADPVFLSRIVSVLFVLASSRKGSTEGSLSAASSPHQSVLASTAADSAVPADADHDSLKPTETRRLAGTAPPTLRPPRNGATGHAPLLQHAADTCGLPGTAPPPLCRTYLTNINSSSYLINRMDMQ